ncbi:MAG: hypothetical protein KFH87_07165 [Bacteroidetes bacterium]|nr:hypothetical protein [Bacteroidota bacterium]
MHSETLLEQTAERNALDARIVSDTERLERADAALRRERKKEEDLAFAVQRLADEMRATISGMRQAMRIHHHNVMTVGQVVSECLRILDQRRAAGEKLRSIEKVRVNCIIYSQNVIADEYMLGFISDRSRMGKMVNEVIGEMARRKKMGRPSLKGNKVDFPSETALSILFHHSKRILATLGNPASCRRLGIVSRSLTRGILALVSRMLPGKTHDTKLQNIRARVFFSVLPILVFIRMYYYERTSIDRNTHDRILHARNADRDISRILGTPVSAAEEYMKSRHEILRWNEAVTCLPEDLLRLQQLRKEWRLQTKVTRAVAAQREECAGALQNAMTEYERLYQVPWRPRTKGPVEAGTPAMSRQRVSKKLRNAPEYSKAPEKDRPDKAGPHPGYFSIRESDQWRDDLRDLPRDRRRAFSDAAGRISRQEARKPIGSSQGRKFYSIPLGDTGRLVYSVDSGIAVLERAFGKASRVEDYRKYRKDIQKGRV